METAIQKILFPKRKVFVILLFLFTPLLYSQSCYNPYIDSIVSKVSLQSICLFDRELSGDTSTIIGGQPYTIISRYWEHEGNQKAAQYIYEKFQSYGLETRYQVYSPTGANVLAKKTGTKYPNKQYIICAHYDSYAYGVPSLDTVPGADDNASGTSCVLEAARILSPYNFDYTIIFAVWDEEEMWMVGSYNYVDTAVLRGDSILNVFNLDMIGYDGNNDNVYRIWSDSASGFYANVFAGAGYLYQPQLCPRTLVGTVAASDHLPFIEKGYNAICCIENSPDFNPYYHTQDEKFYHFNLPYFEGLVKTAIASLLVMQYDAVIYFDHTPLQSSYDTTARTLTAVITSNHPLAKNRITKMKYAPRLYYKVNDGPFSYMNAYYNHNDTFKFVIPGQPVGSTVSYYMSAQDSMGTMVGSLPSGAMGISPPGTISPPQLLAYRILRLGNYCSNTLPKAILPMQILYDTIHISQTGNIYDYDLNLTIYHTRDSSLYIWLTRPGSTLLPLSMANGDLGENYFNTTFDDEANISITEGVPPFIGSYRPESPLSTYDNLSMQGLWILRIFNYSQTVTGQLTNWCMRFDYYDPIGIVKNQIPVKSSLSQNYPNPFNSSTKINFSISKQSHVMIVVYDILGREVKVLVNNILNYGEHKLSYDANNVASGLYFYSMYLDGNLFETKKMVLVK